MKSFTYFNPVKLIFGDNSISRIGEEISENQRVLLTYGGGSIKKNGVYDRVLESLKNHTIVEFSGIEVNPDYDTLIKGVELARKEKIDLILAVGGGSVIDGSKFMAAAIPFEGSDPYEIIAKRASIRSAVPLGCVLTLPATGTEMNVNAVISRRSKEEKSAISSPFLYPKFSVLDPAATYSLPEKQIRNGIIDAFVHVMEQYLTYPVGATLQDRFAESIISTLIEIGPLTLSHPEDYLYRANFMWAATMALNGLIGMGVPQDWATHQIGHHLTALYGMDHAETLGVVLPSLWKECFGAKKDKLAQYGERVWGFSASTNETLAELAIERTISFFHDVGMATALADYSIPDDVVEQVLTRMEARGQKRLGEKGEVTPEVVAQILKRAK